MLTRQGYLVEEEGVSYMADMVADHALSSLQAAACTYRIALGPRAGQKLPGLRTLPGRDEKAGAGLCAAAHGFSLHAGVRCGAHQRKQLERLCRYITRPAIANERARAHWRRRCRAAMSLQHTLDCAGFGWLRHQGVRSELERMTHDWKGPLLLPTTP